MGTPKRFPLNRPDRAKAVADAVVTGQDVRDQQRRPALRLAASGPLAAAPIAGPSGLRRRQFFNWVGAPKEGGGEGLLARGHGGGPAPLVHGKGPEEFQAGLKAGQWKRAKEIQPRRHRRHQVKPGLKGGDCWLGKLGGVLKGPRQSHAKKDAATAAQCQQQLCATLKNLNVAGGKPVRLWGVDEPR